MPVFILAYIKSAARSPRASDEEHNGDRMDRPSFASAHFPGTGPSLTGIIAEKVFE